MVSNATETGQEPKFVKELQVSEMNDNNSFYILIFKDGTVDGSEQKLKCIVTGTPEVITEWKIDGKVIQKDDQLVLNYFILYTSSIQTL